MTTQKIPKELLSDFGEDVEGIEDLFIGVWFCRLMCLITTLQIAAEDNMNFKLGLEVKKNGMLSRLQSLSTCNVHLPRALLISRALFASRCQLRLNGRRRKRRLNAQGSVDYRRCRRKIASVTAWVTRGIRISNGRHSCIPTTTAMETAAVLTSPSPWA